MCLWWNWRVISCMEWVRKRKVWVPAGPHSDCTTSGKLASLLLGFLICKTGSHGRDIVRMNWGDLGDKATRWLSGKEIYLLMQEMQETWVQSLGREDSLEEEMAAHSNILAWKTPWTEDPGGLKSIGLHRVRSDLATEHSWRLVDTRLSVNVSYYCIWGWMA